MIQLLIPIIAMVVVVASSNVLVQYPVNDWLTWGALTYPIAFVITDLTNRALGAQKARRVVQVGFAAAVILSLYLATPRIALASGTAFLVAQLLDIRIFDHLRGRVWWQAPLASTVMGSAVDTALFFSLAFAGTAVPWVTLAVGDFAIKVGLALVALIPYGAIAFTVLRQRA